MNCDDARSLLSDKAHGRLSALRAEELAAHLEGCAACRREEAAEQALTEALTRRLPRHAAPASLQRRLARELAAAPQAAPRAIAAREPGWRSRLRAAAPALAVGLALAAAVTLYYERAVLPRAQATADLDLEAVNDHLRIVYSEHPLEVESGGIHQVKPWFTGRLDFAPKMTFAGDDEFPLLGGAVSYFIDRKAAALVFKRRLHTISLFVFRADGLAWPASGLVPVGHARGHAATIRGFNLLLWRDGELGYALVSDVDAADLTRLAAKVAAP